MNGDESFLRAILATVARQTFPPARIGEIVGTGEKQLRAFNLCDGTRTQADIVKELGLDKSNFSKTLGRWVDEGIAIRVGKDSLPLHVYPLPASMLKKATKE